MIFGEVLQAGVGQNPARQVLFKSGLAKTVTAEPSTRFVPRVCLRSSTRCARSMRERTRVIAAGGMESMSNAPYLLKDARRGYRFGDGTLIDAMIYDGLWDQYFPMTMAAQGSNVADRAAVSRAKIKIALRTRAIAARTRARGRPL